MNWWRQLWGGVQLDGQTSERLAQWRALPRSDLRQPLSTQAMVVVDVETSGLDVRRDRLLSIGTVPVAAERIVLGGIGHTLLRQEQVSQRDNILIHGIGPTAQSEGMEPVEALLLFLETIGAAPLVAYHAPFDAAVLKRAVRQQLGVTLPNRWLDLAWLLPALFPGVLPPRAPLDSWQAHFGLAIAQRHSADADALMSAELLLIALKRAQEKKIESFHALAALAEAEAQLAAGRGL